MDSSKTVSETTDTLPDFDLDEDQFTPDTSDLDQDQIKFITTVFEKEKTFSELETIRQKKVKESFDEKIIEIERKNVDDGVNFCLVCGVKFRFLITRRRICNGCGRGICKNCVQITKEDSILCNLCYLQCCKEAKTGHWFIVASKQNGRLRKNAITIVNMSFKKSKSKSRAPSIPSEAQKPMGPEIVVESFTDEVDTKGVPGKGDSLRMLVKDTPSQKNYDSMSLERHDSDHSLNSKSKSHHLHTNLEVMKPMSSSSTSIRSEVFESYKHGIPVSGDISLSLLYHEKDSKLEIFIEQCRNLAIADRHKRETNPYVKMYILPDKKKQSKNKTKSKKANVNPEYKEIFTYFINKASLSKTTLSVAVWHKRLLTYNFFIGGILIPLGNADLKTNKLQWYPLQEKHNLHLM